MNTQIPYLVHPANRQPDYKVGNEATGILEVPRVGSLKQGEAELWAAYLADDEQLASTQMIRVYRWCANLMLLRCQWYQALSVEDREAVLTDLPEALVNALYEFFNNEVSQWKVATKETPEETQEDTEEAGKP